MSDDFRTGKGDFGDHAGRAHSFINPPSAIQDLTDPWQKWFWDQKLYVDVCAVELNERTGRQKLVVIGTDVQVDAARDLVKAFTPSIEVVRRPPDRDELDT